MSLKDTAVAAPKMKRSSVTEELMDQDENVFVSRNSHQKGLQQYYTPLKLAEGIARAMQLHSGVVVDFTAGCGNLLAPFQGEGEDRILTLGVELDKGNIPPVTDNCRIVNANLPELYPYLLKVEFQPDIVVLNPPFSLFWKCPELTGTDDKNIESQVATVRIGINLLARGGQGAFIVQKSSWDKLLSGDDEIASRTYLVVTVQNAFLPYSTVECVVGFFSKRQRHYGIPHGVDERERFVVDMNVPNIDMRLAELEHEVQRARREHGVYPSSFSHSDAIVENEKRFRAAFAEYRERKQRKAQKYNIEFVGGRLKVHLSNYTQYVLYKDYSKREQSILNSMHGLSPSYFAFNTQDRRDLFAMVNEKTLVTMSPDAKSAIEKAVLDAEFILTPMYALKPQQRLGYLEDVGQILCVKRFMHGGAYGDKVEFVAGEKYDVAVNSTSVQGHYEKERGALGTKTEMIKVKKALSIAIGEVTFSETPEDISLIINHFEVPDPQDVRSRKPALYTKLRKRLESPEFARFTLRPFQVEDLSRLAMKPSAVLSWEQGLGKTRGALAWSKLRFSKKVLIVCPQDLKRQWIAEAHTLAIELDEIRGYGDIERVRKADVGYFIIHYELLKGSRRLDQYVAEYQKPIETEEGEEYWNALCPKCRALRYDGWTGKSCSKCGYHVWLRRVKGMFSFFKKTFDTVIVDEGVKIKSKHSLQGMAVRSLSAKNRLLLSGSPIKGWITDAFWLLHWTLGNGSPRFPYHYVGGTEKFLDDFGVFEYVAEEFRKSLSKGKKKLLPEIGNLHLLWKLFAPAIVRRVKADTGETLVSKNVHRIKVNFTVSQKETYDWWISNFSEWFKASHKTNMEEEGIQMKEMILGLLWKLRLTATVPASPLLPGCAGVGMEDTFYEGRQGKSNYTEKALFVLGKVKEKVDRGEQVVVFSALQDNMRFMKQLFDRFGVRSEVANADTNPNKRALLIEDFKRQKFSVLIAGIQAVNLGHNLDNATTVIMTDYEWDHSTTRQAIDRVHRFTSKKDVEVYLVYTDGGVDRKQLFEIIDQKGQSSDLALDGKLLDQEEVQVDFFKMAREILKSHKVGTNGLLQEVDIERQMVDLFRGKVVPPTTSVEESVIVGHVGREYDIEAFKKRKLIKKVEVVDQMALEF